MNNRIHKYELTSPRSKVKTKKNAEFLKASEVEGKIFVWLLVDLDGEDADVYFRVYPTGVYINLENKFYCDTVFFKDDPQPLVFHVFQYHEKD